MNDVITPHDIIMEVDTITKRNGATTDIDQMFDLSTAPSIPDLVYENLPQTLKTRLSLLELKHHRDVVLVGSLPVIASHMPNVLIGHADGYYTPDLFSLIVSPPGSGKGKANFAKKLGSVLNQKMIEQSRQEKENLNPCPTNKKQD